MLSAESSFGYKKKARAGTSTMVTLAVLHVGELCVFLALHKVCGTEYAVT